MNPAVESSFNIKPFKELSPPKINPEDLGNGDEALQLRREAGLA